MLAKGIIGAPDKQDRAGQSSEWIVSELVLHINVCSHDMSPSGVHTVEYILTPVNCRTAGLLILTVLFGGCMGYEKKMQLRVSLGCS